ncbi:MULTISPECIES: LuxR family transcriptional regulator [Vibrio]|uniref:LuxR family transcriptional regulator n=1 Tax=Vibrio TaxID=662 RepID=UPI002075C447|nr:MULTISPECIES: LuxR family transcriptional regulator [Vibrio]USD35117.1 autoinducer binding domain-containing protein [Vibrio sp. SCSIO 43186]USD48183.1 autoinducer binding domain-containing protein [Vibrio sp. SCSIO 43145]USD72242.1 autoinducer binding domain-containing protein [Vibrio sp. SCSIO 43139]USD97917.1 LuxR family transcriptional regulator [Vibrio coralliilyticus]
MKEILRLIDNYQTIDSIDSMVRLLDQLNTIVNSEYFVLGVSFDPHIKNGRFIVVDNFPDECRKDSCNLELMYVDPICNFGASNCMPSVWESAKQIDVHSQALYSLSHIQGIEQGISIPIHGLNGEVGILSFATSDVIAHPANPDALLFTQLIIPLIVQNLPHLPLTSQTKHSQAMLTNREIECLTWAADGKSALEIAELVDCTERTVKFHLSNACKKLGATNRCQAVTRALLGGHIKPHQ